jgi:hypothetical protein
MIPLPGIENAVVCDKCGFPFRPNYTFTDRLRDSCPRCGARGPFRKATDADIGAFVRSRALKPSDWLKVVAGLIVVGAIVAVIMWLAIDA